MKVIAVTNRKGGVGKSTFATHIAAGLAKKGYRVGLADTDSQGHAALMLGVPEENGLFHLLIDKAPLKDVVRQIPIENYSDTPTQGVGVYLRNVQREATRLAKDKYLHQQRYRHGPLFRAHKNYRGGALRYQSVQEKWAKYCEQAGIHCTLHQLRHAHATELVNDGVSLATIRKRLGHKHIQTTLRYAQQSDEVTDSEIRAWRRRQSRQ